jgi:hypothetical protein
LIQICVSYNEKPEGERSLGRSRCKWEDNIKIEFREKACVDVNWIHLAEYRLQTLALVNTVMDVRFQLLAVANMKMKALWNGL